MSSGLRAWCLVVLFGAGSWPPLSARAEVHAVDEHVVVGLVQKHNPTLKAALEDVESARADVMRLDAQYLPVIQVDGSTSDVQSPQLYINGSVRTSEVRRVDLGAELRKHLLWGTDLTLRLSGNVQQTKVNSPASAGFTGMTGTGTTGMVPGLTPLGTYGPGYGVMAKLTLKQPLLRGRGQEVAEADLNAARVQRTASEFTRDRVASELLRDSLTAYWELWYAQSAEAIQAAALEVAQRQRSEAQARVDTGGLAPVEVLTFETQVAARAEDVAAAQAERTRRELELLRLLGDETTRGPLTVDDETPTARVSAAASDPEARALERSAEVHQQQATLELARVRARTATEPQRQRLDLDAYAQVQDLGNQDARDAFRGGPAYGGFIALTYEAPVMGRAERSAAAKARADVESAEQQLVATRQNVTTQVRTAVDRLSSQERLLELAEQTRAVAERQWSADQARFLTGATTALQVIEAEDKLRAAQLRVVRAHANLVQTALSLDHLTGQLLDRWASR